MSEFRQANCADGISNTMKARTRTTRDRIFKLSFPGDARALTPSYFALTLEAANEPGFQWLKL
jgi:hypothetical protein